MTQTPGNSINLIRTLVQERTAAARAQVAARVEQLPADLQNTQRTLNVNGQVTQQNPVPTTGETQITVQTIQGEVQVTLPPEQPPPQTGSIVEIQVPPQTNSAQNTTQSQTVQVQIEVPRATAQPQTQTEIVTPQPSPEQPPTRTSTTPVNVEVTQTTTTSAPPQIQNTIQPPQSTTPQPLPTTLPNADSVVRLLALPPVDINTLLATNTPNDQPPALQSQVTTAPNISALTVEVLNAALNTPPSGTPLVPQTQTTLTQSALAELNTTVSTLRTTSALNLATQQVLQQTTPLLSSLNTTATQVVQTGQNIATTQLQIPVLNTPQIDVRQTTLSTIPQLSAAPALAPPALLAPGNTTGLILGSAPGSTLGGTSQIATQTTSQLITTTPLENLQTTSTQSRIQALDVRILSVDGTRIELAATPQAQESTATQQPQPANAPSNPHIQTTNATQTINAHTPATFTGTIIGTTTDSLPILSVTFGAGVSQSFIIQAPTQSVTPGTTVTLTPQSATATTTPSITQTSSPLAPLPASLAFAPYSVWAIMDEVHQALTQNAPPQVAQAFSNVIPTPSTPAQVLPAAMFFISAIRGGDISSWLGDKATDALRNSGKSNLLNRLTQEGSLLNRLGAEPATQDWRSLALPMFHDGEIQKIALHYRREDNSESETQEGGKTTRFIFDLSLSRMGKVQVDGLFRPDGTEARLDVVVRSEDHFSQAMRANMKQTYTRALGHSGFNGDLTFQGQLDSWVTIQREDESALGVDA